MVSLALVLFGAVVIFGVGIFVWNVLSNHALMALVAGAGSLYWLYRQWDEDEDEKPARRSRRQAEPDEGEVERPRSRVAAAPVSRGGNQFFSSRNMNASQVKLPSDLANFVKQAGLNPTEYALGIVAEIKAGKLPKQWLDPDYDRGIK